MLWVDMLMRYYVVIGPYYVLADGTANFIIYFDNYIIVTDVIVTGPDVFKPILFIMSLWSMMLKNHWVSGGHHGPGVKGCYLNLSSGDLTNTSSHICGSWYLPIFLFRDGSLTLISIAPLMTLAIIWSSLPTMLKFSTEGSWPVMLWWSWMGERVLICSLNLSANALPDSPMYSSSQSTLPHLYL